MLRNWAAETDFATMGAIALLACRQMVCKECEQSRDHSNHQDHDWVFRRWGIIGVFLLIWILSLVSILPDCFGWTGGYKWTNTTYGCDNVYCDHNKKSYGMIANILINTFIIFMSYCSIVKKLVEESLEESLDSNLRPVIYQKIKMLMSLAITYTICVIPVSFFCWGIFRLDWFEGLDNVVYEQLFEAILNCLYWSMFSINFLLYYLPNSGIRRAYDTFFRDFKKWFIRSLKQTKRQHPPPPSPVSQLREWDLGKDNPNSKIQTTRVSMVVHGLDRTIVETKM